MVVASQVHIFSVAHLLLTADSSKRLLAACALGGIIGVEREWRHKDSGLRTNMLICMGAALFTIMSAVLAGDLTPDKSRVASNIVQGVGFLGAGLILHTKDRVLGLTSAATVFVVAAMFATIIVLLSLQTVGALEAKIGWKRYPMLYEVRAEVGAALPLQGVQASEANALSEERESARHRMFTAILKVLDAAGQRLQVLDRDNVAGMERVSFTVLARSSSSATSKNRTAHQSGSGAFLSGSAAGCVAASLPGGEVAFGIAG
jgi:putative Mg2+ transporter-C (MgtC) family protein